MHWELWNGASVYMRQAYNSACVHGIFTTLFFHDYNVQYNVFKIPLYSMMVRGRKKGKPTVYIYYYYY